MKDLGSKLSSEVKLNALAKSIYDESIEMGFKSNDYVKLLNELIDMTIKKGESTTVSINDENKGAVEFFDMPIKTKNLVLRYYEPENDKTIVSKWFQDPLNRLFLPSMISDDSLDIDHLENSDRNIFAMIDLINGESIGLMALLNIDKLNSKAEMRKMIGEPKYRGQGYAKEATGVWLKFCTEYLDISKIYIHTIETNIKNVSINRQLGLKVEGLLKREFKVENTHHDVLRMAYFKR